MTVSMPFATMGGFVYIYGLVEAADNVELAVLAHEIGHIASRHLVEQMQRQRSPVAATAAGLNRNTAVQIGVDLLFTASPVGRMNLKQIEGDSRF